MDEETVRRLAYAVQEYVKDQQIASDRRTATTLMGAIDLLAKELRDGLGAVAGAIEGLAAAVDRLHGPVDT